MFKKALILSFIFGLACPLLARGQTCLNVPDTATWQRTDFFYITIAASNGRTIYLGYEAEYKNLSDSNDLVKLVARFNSIVSVPASRSDEAPYVQIANDYLDKETKEKLEEAVKNSDIFLYIRSKTKFDSQVGDVIPDGPAESWLIGQNGECLYGAVRSIFVKDVSEPNKYEPEHFIVVGKRYRLNGVNHVLRADQDNIIERKEK